MPVFLMTAHALFLGGLGLALNFASPEIAGALGLGANPVIAVMLQVFAGALLALGLASWFMRRVVNGIFGRALGLGNLLFHVVSAFALLRAANAGIAASATWPLGLLTAGLAIGFIWLVFVGQGSRTPATC